MKKIITCICICLFCAFSVSAQGRKHTREKIKTLKIAYLTEKLNLTATEAQKFWPIYNSYYQKQSSLKSKLRLEIKKTIKEKGNINSVSEKEAEKLVALKLTTNQQVYEAHKSLINEIKKIISYKKIIQLELAEKDFGRKLMHKYKRKKRNFKN